MRFLLACLVLSALAVFGLGMWYYSSTYYTNQRRIVDQPVPFSHRHHAGELGIDCRYCHTSVETSSFAGVPGASTCMHCHSQMWPAAKMLEPVRESFRTGQPIHWTRVHNLPHYVYFNHSIHVAKGIGCASCHGRIDKMALTRKSASLQMLWCLDCHRHPEQHVRPREEITNMNWKPLVPQSELGPRLVKEYHIMSKTDCYTCHR